jgi:UDP-N-acetylmuramoyl-L-alanyl-D-glutamate--2,6-diaminopimelate ligase
MATARAGDVVVVAGKGHESTQDHGDTAVAFDDREITRAVLQELGQAR